MVSAVQVAECDERVPAERVTGSSNLVGDTRLFFAFLLHFCSVLFFPCQETILPKGNVCLSVSCIKKSSEASNYSFLMFAFELAISRRFVKDKPRRLS